MVEILTTNVGVIKFCTNSQGVTSGSANTGPDRLSPICLAYMYIKDSGNNHRTNDDVNYASWSRYDVSNITSIDFYYSRYSWPWHSQRRMCTFGIKLLNDDSSWHTVFSLKKWGVYSGVWTEKAVSITMEINGILFFMEKINLPCQNCVFQ